ncbi:50S ribosomal protein L21 [Candidatus Beckwithbacteria bacterium RBG_13_35_6]|uniref:Large ribosomal subunit protein bL21 n=1 Tax=Candidatus Beckwithbacteria bacterium RBG_13_35_6 TaxID=1797456 RepID=A0A1F5DG25_9BACT|nr:MAG: 50S ribosomal protein L21 [Candidatus Beckwithbacteria bacterium RBG_13_35_6]
MKYAIILTGGKQYKVTEGETLAVDKLLTEAKKKLIFDQVLLIKDNEKLLIGKPFLNKAKVEAELIDQFKDKKIRVAKFKAKSRYRRVRGHRQPMTRIKITKIT